MECEIFVQKEKWKLFRLTLIPLHFDNEMKFKHVISRKYIIESETVQGSELPAGGRDETTPL
jgi:hypothetical protein